MANTKKVNSTNESAPKADKISNQLSFEKNLIKKMKYRKNFAGLTYANNILGVIVFIFAIATLFGARSTGSRWWMGFWSIDIIVGGQPVSYLSGIGIATIVLIAILGVFVLVQLIGNLALKNKLKLLFATRVSCILFASSLLMMVLGICAQPALSAQSSYYISWIRCVIDDNVTHLTSGAIVILIQMILMFAYCIARVIFYFVVEAKKLKIKKDISNDIKTIKEQLKAQDQE